MNSLRWVAWGSVDIEALDKQQRRNYLKKVREELAVHGFTLHPGGSKKTPHYTVTDRNGEKHITAGPGAFAKACAHVLEKIIEGKADGEQRLEQVETVA